jgi:hypothetical protein
MRIQYHKNFHTRMFTCEELKVTKTLSDTRENARAPPIPIATYKVALNVDAPQTILFTLTLCFFSNSQHGIVTGKTKLKSTTPEIF